MTPSSSRTEVSELAGAVQDAIWPGLYARYSTTARCGDKPQHARTVTTPDRCRSGPPDRTHRSAAHRARHGCRGSESGGWSAPGRARSLCPAPTRAPRSRTLQSRAEGWIRPPSRARDAAAAGTTRIPVKDEGFPHPTSYRAAAEPHARSAGGPATGDSTKTQQGYTGGKADLSIERAPRAPPSGGAMRSVLTLHHRSQRRMETQCDETDVPARKSEPAVPDPHGTFDQHCGR